MSYAGYVAAAYAVFVVVLLWDYVGTRLRIRRALRAATRVAVRGAPHARSLESGR